MASLPPLRFMQPVLRGRCRGLLPLGGVLALTPSLEPSSAISSSMRGAKASFGVFLDFFEALAETALSPGVPSACLVSPETSLSSSDRSMMSNFPAEMLFVNNSECSGIPHLANLGQVHSQLA